MRHPTYFYHSLRNLPKSEDGQDLAEYMLLVALIAVMVIGAISLIGGEVEDIFVQSVPVIGRVAGSAAGFLG